MPATARGDQGFMRRVGSIVGEYSSPDIGQRTACFVHQKVGRRKVPIVARPPRERNIERALGDARQPQRERMNFRHRLDAGHDGGETLEAGAGTLVKFEPDERHVVASDTGAKILLLLAPWPGEGHYRGSEPPSG